MSGSGGGYRRDLPPYQRGDNRGLMAMSRGGPPSPRPMMSPPNPAGRYGGGGGYMGEVRANPWLVPPGAGASNFDRHMDTSGSYGSPSALMARREMPPLDHGAGPLFGGPSGGMNYGGQGTVDISTIYPPILFILPERHKVLRNVPERLEFASNRDFASLPRSILVRQSVSTSIF